MMAATHDGHRKRMRERFRISGLEGFSEHEVLELILFYGARQRERYGTRADGCVRVASAGAGSVAGAADAN